MFIISMWILTWTITLRHCITATISPFERATSSATFVDKTNLILDVLSNQTHFYILTCPGGFGKSTNHDMLKRFFETTTDQAGQPIRKNQTDNYKLFTNSSPRFRICDHADMMEKHFGKYMVISLDFNTRNATTYQQIIDQLQQKIRRLYDDHRWLYDTYLAQQLISFSFTRKIFKRIYANTPIETDIKNGPRELARIIQYYLKMPVFLLIDNYDMPIWTALHHGADAYRITSLVRDLIQAAVKETPKHIAGAVFAGISGMLINSTALGCEELEDLVTAPFLNGTEYDKYYGFTEAEVTELLQRSGIVASELTQIQRLHGVYRTKSGDLRLYNPTSVLSFLDDKKAILPLDDAPTLPNCLNHTYQRTIIQELILSQKIHIFYQNGIHKESDFKILENMLNPAAHCVQCNTRIYISYLYEIGYVTNLDQRYLSVASSRHRTELEKYLNQFYIRTAHIDANTLKQIATSLHPILNQLSTTDETRQQFKDSLHHHSVLTYLNDDSQPYGYITRKHDFLALVYIATSIHGRHLYDNISTNVAVDQLAGKKVETPITFDEVDMVISSKTQPIVLFVQISSGELVKKTAAYVTQFVPKSYQVQPKYLKYLAISARKGKVDVAFPSAAQYVDGKWQILDIPSP